MAVANALGRHDLVGKMSSDASTSTGDTFAKFYMDLDVTIEDEDDIDPPMLVPPEETIEEWSAQIDVEWEVRRLQLHVDFVPTYQPMSTTWLTLGRCDEPILRALHPKIIVDGTNTPIDHAHEWEAPIEHGIELTRTRPHTLTSFF